MRRAPCESILLSLLRWPPAFRLFSFNYRRIPYNSLATPDSLRQPVLRQESSGFIKGHVQCVKSFYFFQRCEKSRSFSMEVDVIFKTTGAEI